MTSFAVKRVLATIRRKTGPKTWFGLAGALTGGIVLTQQILALRRRFTQVLPHGVLDMQKKGPSYIYVDMPLAPGAGAEEVPREAMLVSDLQVSSQWHTVKSDIPLVWDPDKSGSSENYWQLLRNAKSTNLEERTEAIAKLAQLSDRLHVSQNTQIAQASDMLTAIGLARSKLNDLHCLLRPPRLPECQPEEMEHKFRSILAALPETDVIDCVAYITKHAMDRGHFYSAAGTGGDWYFGSETGMKGKSLQRVPEDVMKMFYLEALFSHSTVPSHRKLIVDHGGLSLLMQVYSSCPAKLEVQTIIAQILANLALDENVRYDIFRTGWVKVLAKMMRDSKVELNLPAGRALANLDRDTVTAKYEEGVYLLHPVHRHEEMETTADVVFIHGISGGAFKTWRQRDTSALPGQSPTGIAAANTIPSEETADKGLEQRRDILMVAEDMTMKSLKRLFPGEQTHGLHDEYERQFQDWLKLLHKHDDSPKHTQCWPKDWLAKDCPFVRILAIDFDAQMSEWFRKCPLPPEKRTLAHRSTELLNRMMKADIGKRPVIWVCHSMGGLLVKKFLAFANASSDPEVRKVWENTKGVVFFGVPHRGSLWANWGGTEFFFLPSAELQELKYNSPQLLDLHVQFQEMAEKVRLPCLSFGETLKTGLGYKLEALFVAPYSSDPGFGVYYTVGTDHVNVCKPVNRRSKLYLRVLEFVFDNIPHTIFDTLMAPNFHKVDYDTIMDSYMMWS